MRRMDVICPNWQRKIRTTANLHIRRHFSSSEFCCCGALECSCPLDSSRLLHLSKVSPKRYPRKWHFTTIVPAYSVTCVMARQCLLPPLRSRPSTDRWNSRGMLFSEDRARDMCATRAFPYRSRCVPAFGLLSCSQAFGGGAGRRHRCSYGSPLYGKRSVHCTNLQPDISSMVLLRSPQAAH